MSNEETENMLDPLREHLHNFDFDEAIVECILDEVRDGANMIEIVGSSPFQWPSTLTL